MFGGFERETTNYLSKLLEHGATAARKLPESPPPIAGRLMMRNQPALAHLFDAATDLGGREGQRGRQRCLIDTRVRRLANTPKNLQFRFSQPEAFGPLPNRSHGTPAGDRGDACLVHNAIRTLGRMDRRDRQHLRELYRFVLSTLAILGKQVEKGGDKSAAM